MLRSLKTWDISGDFLMQVFAPVGSLGPGTSGTADRDLQNWQTAGGTALIASGKTLD